MHTATTQTPRATLALQATYTVAEAAQRLGMRERKLFDWLRVRGICSKTRDGINLPAPAWVTRGYFVVRQTSHMRGGVLNHSASTAITATGLLWLAKQLPEATPNGHE